MNGEQAVPSDETLSSEPQSSPEAIAPAAETAPVVEAAAPAAPALEASPGPESSAPAEGEPVAAAPAEDEEVPKRKVQLNPTQENAPRPVAMFAGTTPAAPPPADAAGAAISDAADAMSSMPMSATVASGPVALPEEKVELEASLEAELEAAMAGELSAPVPVVPEPGTAGDRDAVPLPQSEDQLEPGTRLKAKVQSVTAEDVFCEVGFRVPGVLPLRQFPSGKHPSIGEEFLVHVEKFDPENGVILVNLPKTTRRPKGNWEDLAVGQIVECLANRTNKGGLEVTISNLRGFLPASQVDVGFVSSLDAYVGQKLTVLITEVNPAKRNLVVSRRAIVIAERKELAQGFWEKVEVGQQLPGRVKTIKDYGAFIDLGGVDGFLHVGEMSWTRIKHPSEAVQEGQQVDVVILSLDREKEKIGLGMRQLAQNPWVSAVDKYPVGRTVTGKVSRATDFGAFIELEPGVEGLVHISELDHRRVKKVTDVLTVGQDVQVQVLEVAPDRQRISLSLKALKEKPESEKPKEEEPVVPYERKRKEPLRGGTGGNGGGGLFGNPTDFGR